MTLMWKILDKIRFIICEFLIGIFGVITLPITAVFKWDMLWLLFIANAEKCSLAKAKTMLGTGRKYEVIRSCGQMTLHCNENKGSKVDDLMEIPNSASSPNMNTGTPLLSSTQPHSSASAYKEYQTHPTYSGLSYNVYDRKG